MSGRIEIAFGALSPRLADQPIGPLIDADELDHFQRDADAITRLRIRGLMTPSQADAACRRLVKRLEDAARGDTEGDQ